MADQQTLDVIRQGVRAWNDYRQRNHVLESLGFAKVDLMGADLTGADLVGANLIGANLSGATLNGVTLREAKLGGADLSRTNLSEADLSGANLKKANLSGADLSRATVSEAFLSQANLSGATLSRANLYDATLIEANLSDADLSRANLREADLTGADLTRTNFREVFLLQANLSRTNLSKANLGAADLSRANLSEADLSEANLSEADLLGTNFSDANLSAADLSGAKLHETIFGNTKLTHSRGLDSCKHWGPCSIDHRTLTQSGHLPLRFLRGCGLPDLLIDYLPSLLNQAIQFYSCFISYSTKDQDFAERLHADLQNKGVRCWFAPHNIQGGKKIHEQIGDAIRLYDRLLLILSEASMSSEWVETEIAGARQKELNNGKRVLFPVSLVPFEKVRGWKAFDADIGKDSAREIREYFIPDFSDWKTHDCYQKAFETLLRDLKAERQ